MAKTYSTYHIRVANRDRVQVEKWDAQHQDQGQPSGAFRYQEKLVEIAPLLQAASNNELNDSTLARSLGEALFDVLFDDGLRQDFVSFYNQVVHQEKQLLRVELNIDEHGMSEIAALPWEFMCVPARANLGIIWMGTVPNLVLCRRRSQWSATQSIQLAPDEKIRIALVISAPPNLPPVAYEPVQAALEKLAREQAKRVELLPIVSPATPEAIDTILSKNPHIFYFIGHGRMKNEGNQEVGEMAFVDPDFDDEAMWVDADYFSELFNQHRPGIVILQACESGMLSSSQAFVGVASKVVQQNVPVVVAMQYEVTNSTATKFALHFCQQLAAGDPVDIAAQCGRRAITFGPTQYHKRDFATPVIFMRVKDGYLFKRQSASSQSNEQPDFPVNPQIIQGRDIDKRNIDENGRFIHLLTPDSKLSNFSQESFQDLDFSGIPLESIQKAYQDSLPADADLWDLSPPNADMPDLAGNNIKAILKKMEEFRQLFQFLERLSQNQNLPIKNREEIANQLASKNYPENHNNKSATDFSSNQSGPLKSYLIATLNPGDGDDKFLLNAWLIIDDSVQDLSKFQSLLDQNEQQAGKLCKLTQIPTELNKFLEKALRYLIRRKSNLIIEIFLPRHLMCMEIDRWKITDPIVGDITLGNKYPVRLRSLERLKPKYLYSYLSQWYQSWDKVREILQNEPTQESFEHLKEIESFNCKLLSMKLKEKIGLKVTCSHSKSIREDLFNAILIATTPIAIWTRADIANLDQVTAINDILTFKPLCNLSESVRHHREKADNAQTEEHLGHHLALLWENPYRLTPYAMVELNSPVQ